MNEISICGGVLIRFVLALIGFPIWLIVIFFFTKNKKVSDIINWILK